MVKAPTGGSTEASASARLKQSRSHARRANEATRHLLYLFPLPSSRLGRVTRAHSPLVGSPSRGSVTLCRKLAPIPAPAQHEGEKGGKKRNQMGREWLQVARTMHGKRGD